MTTYDELVKRLRAGSLVSLGYKTEHRAPTTKELEAADAIEALQRDSQRYRHLRDCNSGSPVIVQITGTGYDDQVVLTEADADSAIDAAIKKDKS